MSVRGRHLPPREVGPDRGLCDSKHLRDVTGRHSAIELSHADATPAQVNPSGTHREHNQPSATYRAATISSYNTRDGYNGARKSMLPT